MAARAKKAKKPAARKKAATPLAMLRKFALAYPETREDRPWGEYAIKVRGKTFVFLGQEGMSVKLPQSREFALEYPFTKPTPYGLGKSGWVSAQFEKAPIDVLKAWIDESFRAIAPKKLTKKAD
ncbi:MAG TPA: MmcQ/YjbR family DNA-binding protein [Rhizomicrobium sp.]|nr:MmcQ/YjbR family DNA-binding protein [Rhizomicrobium sp.]